MTEQTKWTFDQKAQILRAMDDLVSDPKFHSSRRCVLLLRYLVQHDIDGDLEGIKERRLGVEVFGRHAEYDTNDDPVVRVTASEIRKRLARVYSEMPHPPLVKIHLNSGSYLPSYEFPEAGVAPPDAEAQTASITSHESAQNRPGPALAITNRHRTMVLYLSAAGLLLLLVLALVYETNDGFRTTDYLLWKPLLDPNREVLVCVPSYDATKFPLRQGAAASATNAGQAVYPHRNLNAVRFQETNTAYKLARRLTLLKQPSNLHDAAEIAFTDFHKNPAVLIGGLDNPWTLKLLSKLRYRIEMNTETGDRWIVDSQKPAQIQWKVDGHSTKPDTDYAIVTRYYFEEAGGWVMAISGLGPNGTESAADLVTATYLHHLIPASLRTAKNFQIVIAVPLVEGAIGAPHVLTTYTW